MTEYDIYYEYANGRKSAVNWPKFHSAIDAVKSVAMLMACGIPEDVVRVTAEDANGNWLCEITRRGK